MYGVWHVPTAATISPIAISPYDLCLCLCPLTLPLPFDLDKAYRFMALSILSNNAIVLAQLAALDSGSRPSRMALTNSTS
jgi:hypothetical protein